MSDTENANLPDDEIKVDYEQKQKKLFYKIVLAVLGAVILVFVIWLIWFLKETGTVAGAVSIDETNRAIQEAYKVYDEYKSEGLNMESGPCLTNNLIDDWVLDVVHNPRTEEDDRYENQCKDFLLGKKKHFVELTPDGELVRAI